MTLLHLTVFECLLIVANIACVAKCDNSVARTPDDVATLNLVVREILGRLDEKDSQLKEQSRQLKDQSRQLNDQSRQPKEQSNLLEELSAKLDDQQTIIDNQNERLKHLEADASNAKHRSFSKDDVTGYAIYDDNDKKDVDVDDATDVKNDDVIEDRHVATGPQRTNTESVKRTGDPLFRKTIIDLYPVIHIKNIVIRIEILSDNTMLTILLIKYL